MAQLVENWQSFALFYFWSPLGKEERPGVCWSGKRCVHMVKQQHHRRRNSNNSNSSSKYRPDHVKGWHQYQGTLWHWVVGCHHCCLLLSMMISNNSSVNSNTNKQSYTASDGLNWCSNNGNSYSKIFELERQKISWMAVQSWCISNSNHNNRATVIYITITFIILLVNNLLSFVMRPSYQPLKCSKLSMYDLSVTCSFTQYSTVLCP